MAHTVETVSLPAHWACYLAYGDCEGLAEGEPEHIDDYVKDFKELYSKGEEAFFAWNPEPWFCPDTKGGDFEDYTYFEESE